MVCAPPSCFKSPPVTVQDVERLQYKETWLSVIRAELEGRKNAGTFAFDKIRKDVNAITGKWVSSWNTDTNGLITKAKARILARGFGQRYAVDYFETFADTPVISSKN